MPVEAQTRDELGRRLRHELRQRGDLLLLAPVVRNRKGFHTDVAEWAASHGYAEVRADGKFYPTSERLRLDRFREHDVEIVVGVLDAKQRVRRPGERASSRARTSAGNRARGEARPPSVEAQPLIDETLKLGQGTLFALDNHGHTSVHSTERACPECGRSFEALDPKNFSYNSPQGWCPRCRGFGELFYLPDVDRGARADAIEESWYSWQEGEREICPDCGGARLNPIARAVRLRIANFQSPVFDSDSAPTIDALGQMPVEDASRLFGKIQFKGCYRARHLAGDSGAAKVPGRSRLGLLAAWARCPHAVRW